MSIYEKWRETVVASSQTEETQQAFWDDFCAQEKGIYEKILGEKKAHMEGTFQELTEQYGVSPEFFMGFLDGINDSIDRRNDLEDLKEEDALSFDINFETLYYNMLAVPAPWLYELEEWDGILTPDQKKSIEKEYKRSKIVVKENRIGRNDPCPCGSGKKYKKCCGKAS